MTYSQGLGRAQEEDKLSHTLRAQSDLIEIEEKTKN